jgi:hypothetical protein
MPKGKRENERERERERERFSLLVFLVVVFGKTRDSIIKQED